MLVERRGAPSVLPASRDDVSTTRFDPRKIYRFDATANVFHVDVVIRYYRDLYNEWDYAPFVKRDLDRDLMEHLEECSREIPLKAGIAITFFLPVDIRSDVKEQRSITGLRHYFRYACLKAERRRRRYLRSFGLYLIFGVAFLAAAYTVQRFLRGPFPVSLLPEGLLIGGWVLFWEAFSILFFRSRAVGERIRHLRRLLNAGIAYVYKDRSELDRP